LSSTWKSIQNKWLIKGLEKCALKTKRGKVCGYSSTKVPINETIRALVCHETPYPKVLPHSASILTLDVDMFPLGNTFDLGIDWPNRMP
jgi:hypothetical protein